MAILIVYYSLTGNNRALAQAMSNILECNQFEIKEVTQRSFATIILDHILKRSPEITSCPFDLSTFDHVIFISPVWSGKIATPLTTLLQRQKDKIREYSFIALGWRGTEQREGIIHQFVRTFGFSPKRCKIINLGNLLNAANEQGRLDTVIKAHHLDSIDQELTDFIQSLNLMH